MNNTAATPEKKRLNNYLLKSSFWEAFIIVTFYKSTSTPKWYYGWWNSRLNLIKKGEI